ncbi:MAG: HlyD family secretion protein [Xenococcaceae cyanobacterium]
MPFPKISFRTLRYILAITIAAGSTGIVLKNYMQVKSHRAFVNAPITKISTSIGGLLELKQNLRPGLPLSAETVLGRINNQRSSNSLLLGNKRQELQSQLKVNQKVLESIEQSVIKRQKQVEQFSEENQLGNNLDIKTAKERVIEAQHQLKENEYAAQTAKTDAERSLFLFKEGALSKSAAERDMSRSKQAEANVEAARARLAQAEIQLETALAGLPIESSQTLSDSEIRKRLLLTEIEDLQNQAAVMRTQIGSAKEELAFVTRQLKQHNAEEIKMPFDGVVWSVDSKTGEYLTPGTSIVEVLNCKNSWVDAFFSEKDIQNLVPGASVEVKLLDSNRQLLVEGTIQAIRGGAGQVVTSGEDVAIPPPGLAPRQVAVRVAVNWSELPNPQKLCYVGRNIEVSLPRKFAFAHNK